MRTILAFLLLVVSVLTAQTPPAPPTVVAPALPDSSAYIVNGHTLFWLYGNEGPFSAQDRVVTLERKLENLKIDQGKALDSLSVLVDSTGVYLAEGNHVLLTVTELDAQHWGTSKTAVVDSMITLIRTHQQESFRRAWLLHLIKRIALIAGISILIIALYWFMIRILRLLFRKVHSWLATPENRVVRHVQVKQYQVLSADRIRIMAAYLVRAASMLIYIFVTYLFLTGLIAVIPGTRPVTRLLLSFVLKPLATIWSSFVAFIPNLFFIAVILLVFHYFMKLLKFLAREIETGNLHLPGFYPDWARPTYLIIRFLALAFMLVVMFPYLPGSSSPAFKGVSIFLGVLFSLGSSTAVTNIVAGIIITYMRSFQVGDWVSIGDTTGEVTERRVLTTRIRTPKNEEVSIPNSSILTNQVHNYSALAGASGLLLHTTVTIGYDVPWRQVHELLIDAARRTEGVDGEPFVLQKSLDDFFITYELNACVHTPERMPAMYSQLHQNIQDCFREVGVEILSPHYRALRDGNALTWGAPSKE